MAGIALHRGGVAQIDDSDVDRVAHLRWENYPCNGIRYAAVRTDAGLVLMHRFLLNAQSDQLVDHADGDGLNNRRSNIRICTHAENMQNRRVSKSNKLGVKNVYEARNRHGKLVYIAEIRADGRRTARQFASLEQAIEAAEKLRLAFHGEFATRLERVYRQESVGHAASLLFTSKKGDTNDDELFEVLRNGA